MYIQTFMEWIFSLQATIINSRREEKEEEEDQLFPLLKSQKGKPHDALADPPEQVTSMIPSHSCRESQLSSPPPRQLPLTHHSQQEPAHGF